MNDKTRKQINALQDKLTAYKARYEAFSAQAETLRTDLEEITNEIEGIRDDEQDKFDNLPEGLAEGDRGQDIRNAIDELEEALSSLSEVAENLPPEMDDLHFDNAFSNLDNARA